MSPTDYPWTPPVFFESAALPIGDKDLFCCVSASSLDTVSSQAGVCPQLGSHCVCSTQPQFTHGKCRLDSPLPRLQTKLPTSKAKEPTLDKPAPGIHQASSSIRQGSPHPPSRSITWLVF